MPGYEDANGINRYQPTTGEAKMLGDFNNRMEAMDRVASAANQPGGLSPANSEVGATSRPPIGADATGTLPGQTGYNQGQPSNSAFSTALDGVTKAGTRTERQAYGAALGGLIKADPTLANSADLADAMRGAGTRTARAAFGSAMADQMVRGFSNGGKPRGLAAEAHNIRENRQAMRAAQGGKIMGPGTATSDSIPAQVSPSGENILVSNGERIVSVEQEIMLRRIAEMLGFDSVDALFEHMTGKPVGPTMKAGKKAAATGMAPEDQFGQSSGTSLAPLNGQTSRQGYYPSKLEQAMTGAQVVPAAANVRGGDIGPSKFVQSFQADLARLRGPEQAVPSSNEGRAVPQPVTNAGQHPVSVPASRAAGSLLMGAEPIDNMKPMDLTTKDIAPGGYIDRGNGILAQRSKTGQLNVTNVGTGDLTDPSKRAVDDSASAAIDRQGSTYNPTAQLERMRRLRMESDASNPDITDPNVRRNAQVGLGLLAGGEQADAATALHRAQTRQVEATTAQTQQMENLRGKLLDPKTPEDERQRLMQSVMAISGHQQRTAPYQVHDVEEPLDPNQPLLGNRKVPNRFNPNTGQLEPFKQAQPTDPMAQARAAIQRGADPKAVNARLKQLGLPEVK